ncbi:4-hydroxyacetophenone monooxygenase [Xylophilus ampelinus]|nr:4-hydroxyacetophenone monooxygenase [Xylophilus ampelinus]
MDLTVTPSASAMPGGDVMEQFNRFGPIEATDEHIRQAVEEADLPALMTTLAMITGDTALIAADLKPPSPPMLTTIAPQGGMSQAAQDKARALATAALIAYRDQRQVYQGSPAPELLDACVKYLIQGDIEEHRALLEHELGIARDPGAPDWTREQLAPGRAFRVAIIGAGVSGIAAAYRLQQANVDFTVYEKNDEVGGVWWENRYPGCRLDTPNFAYSLSFAQKPDWPQQFSLQPEIHAYLKTVADSSGVRSRINFGCEVDEMRFDEALGAWRLTVRERSGGLREEVFDAVLTAVGILNRPSLPDLQGIESFKGTIVHSATWPSELDLHGKKVALVGTGASAFQIGPSIVDDVAQLTVFQRNPPWMLPTPTYHDDIRPGMQWLLQHVPYYGRWVRFWQFWIAVEGRLPLTEVEDDWDHPVSVGRKNEELRQGCIRWLAGQYDDRPDLLAKMTPNYPPSAKRMLRDNGVWAAMLKRPHVELSTIGIDSVTPSGIRTADGETHDFDVLVFATGFKASDFLSPMKVVGRGGRDLHRDVWAGDCRAYLGITVPSFPNLFMLGGPNTAVVINGSAIFSSECQVEYTMRALRYLLASGHKAIDCRATPYEDYNAWIDSGNLKRAWGAARTSSWYKNSNGRASQTWPYGLLEYWNVTAQFEPQDYEHLG